MIYLFFQLFIMEMFGFAPGWSKSVPTNAQTTGMQRATVRANAAPPQKTVAANANAYLGSQVKYKPLSTANINHSRETANQNLSAMTGAASGYYDCDYSMNYGYYNNHFAGYVPLTSTATSSSTTNTINYTLYGRGIANSNSEAGFQSSAFPSLLRGTFPRKVYFIVHCFCR